MRITVRYIIRSLQKIRLYYEWPFQCVEMEATPLHGGTGIEFIPQ